MPDARDTSEPGSEPARRIAPGDVLAGKYRVDEVLGEGGMGQVLQAMHLGLDQKVAVKALLPQMLKSEEAVTRFTREAKALAKIQSEHVARVFDVGTLESGLPYMVMEYLDGSDLSDLLRARGPTPIADAAELALQTCAGLAAVHAAGIVHRDLKPSNVYVVTREGGAPCVKLLDFGISKFEGEAITRTMAIMGSPGYMSPEQIRSTKDVDERTDVWALGTILYELLTGEHAFVAENAPMLCIKVTNDEPAPPRARREDIPAELEKIVLRCLAKDPDARYGDVAELARDLAPFAPPRARPLVGTIDGILRGAGRPQRSARAAAGGELHERATVRATPDSARKLAAREDSDPAPARSDAREPRREPRARPAPRGRGRLVVFAMGSLLGAGVAAAYLGDVQKIAAYIGVRTPDAAPAGDAGANVNASAPGVSSAAPLALAPLASGASAAPAAPLAAPDAAPLGIPDAALALIPDALDASSGAELDDDAGDDDDDDAAAPADAAPTTARPAATPKRRPHTPHHGPRRPRHR